MGRDTGIGMKEVPLLDWASGLMGFISGGLIVGGILSEGVFLKAIFILIGIFLFLYDLIPARKNMYGITAIVFLLIGGIAALLISMNGLGFWYTVLLLVVGLGKCARDLRR